MCNHGIYNSFKVNRTYGAIVKVLGVWNPKGGVGKTTLTLNLAASLASGTANRKVVVTDEDPQGSAHKAAAAGKLPFQVISGTPTNPDEVDFWIVDYKAGDRQVPGMQHLLIPTGSSQVEIDEFLDAVDAAMADDKSIYYVHNRFDPRLTLDAENKRLLAQLGAMKVGQNTCFLQASDLRTTIYDKAVKSGKVTQIRGQLDIITGALWQTVPDIA
jgi:chromosome partitioning protein